MATPVPGAHLHDRSMAAPARHHPEVGLYQQGWGTGCPGAGATVTPQGLRAPGNNAAGCWGAVALPVCIGEARGGPRGSERWGGVACQQQVLLLLVLSPLSPHETGLGHAVAGASTNLSRQPPVHVTVGVPSHTGCSSQPGPPATSRSSNPL